MALFVYILYTLRIPGSERNLDSGSTKTNTKTRTRAAGTLRQEIVATFSYNENTTTTPFGAFALGSSATKGKGALFQIDCGKKQPGNVQVSSAASYCTATCGKSSGPLLPMLGSDSTGGSVTTARIHVIVDHSIVECIFNNRTAMAVTGVVGSSADDTDVGLFGVGGAGQATGTMKAWALQAANNL